MTRVNKVFAEERFKEISEAYWILKDPKRCMEYDRTLPAPIKEVRGPPPWERQEEVEWIWDERQLRYRKKPAYEEGVIDARSPFSFIRRGVVYRRKTLLDKLKERVFAGAQSFRFWMLRRARITRLRYRLFLDWAYKRRLYVRRARKRPHKILKAKEN